MPTSRAWLAALAIQQHRLRGPAVRQGHAARRAPQRVPRGLRLGPLVARRLQADGVVDAGLFVAALEAEPDLRDRQALGRAELLEADDRLLVGGHLAGALHAHLGQRRLHQPGVAFGAGVDLGVEVLARLDQPAFGHVEIAQQGRGLAGGERRARAVRVAAQLAFGRGRKQRDDAVDQAQRTRAVALAQVPGKGDGGGQHVLAPGAGQYPLEFKDLGIGREEFHIFYCRTHVQLEHPMNTASACQIRHIRAPKSRVSAFIAAAVTARARRAIMSALPEPAP